MLCFFLALSDITYVAASSSDVDRHAFSHSSPNLDDSARLNFTLGSSLFRRMWATAPASTQAADGLGPLYNARSCMSCHPKNGRGLAPVMSSDATDMLITRVDIPAQNEIQRRQLAEYQITNVPEPTYGMQMQYFAIPGHKAESVLEVDYKEIPITLADGSRVMLRKPTYNLMQLNYGPLHSQARLSPRVAPQIIGLGLLEAISEQDILKQADPNDSDNNGISGRVNFVWSKTKSKVVLGRFGYKASMPSVNEQILSAFSRDLGLSVAFFSQAYGDCTPSQTTCLNAPNGNSPQYENLEAHQQVTDLVNTYVSHIDVPARRKPNDANVLAGEKLFKQIGCDSCHTQSYQTGNPLSAKANYGQDIAPYTDLLLHDMGDGLEDNFPEGVANGSEWRTAPLWGIGLTSAVSGQAQYLHDGRARSLIEAILWHDGEAQTHRDRVIALDRISRKQLITFIESL